MAVVYGHDGFAGELGHTTSVRRTGRLCNCGKVGCLETYASAIGVARTARELLEIEPQRPSILRNIPADEITSKDVAEAAAKGDELSVDVFSYTGRLLGEAFADFVAFSAPEAIILFGGLAQAGELICYRVGHGRQPVVYLERESASFRIARIRGGDPGSAALAWEL